MSFEGDPEASRPNDFCLTEFNVTLAETEARVAALDAEHGASVAAATRIIWVNGDVDPWHGQSNLESPGEEQPVVWPVKGARHCAWMSPERDTDQQSLKDARAAIFAQLEAWGLVKRA